MTNDFTDDYPRCDFCGKTLFFLDGHYRCPEESSHGWHRETIERKGFPKTPETLAELRRAALIEGHDAAHYPTSVVVPTRTLLALLDAAEERDELRGVESRLCLLLCDLTGGLLSKATYPVPTMVAAIEEHLSECHESDLKDERDALAAKVERVRALADEWTYNGEFGWDDGSHAYGTDCVVQALDYAAAKLRRALDEEPQP